MWHLVGKTHYTASDRVNWEKFMGILKDIGVDWRDRRLIQNVYRGQKVKISEPSRNKEHFYRKMGQARILLTPTLLNICGEWSVNEVLEGIDVKVGGNIIKTIKYAEYVALIAKTEEALQKMLDRLMAKGREYGMEIITEKTKVMRIPKDIRELLKIIVNNRELENVSQFRY